MTRFETKRLPVDRDAVAPDGSDVRVLLALRGGSMAHFELAAGQTSAAVRHRTVDEIWWFLSGRGQMWRRAGDQDELVAVEAGVCVTIPVGTQFQFRALGAEPLAALGVTMPPWPGEGEAVLVPGKWRPTLPEARGGPVPRRPALRPGGRRPRAGGSRPATGR
jgi:mannose-6-phosphate isomerase-like protein (cupin superfamily)